MGNKKSCPGHGGAQAGRYQVLHQSAIYNKTQKKTKQKIQIAAANLENKETNIFLGRGKPR